MVELCVSITFLDNRFHGHGDYGPEWPPSPWRLFQSLLAVAAGNNQEKPNVFEWFEKLNAPEILAPDVEDARRRTIFVPNNASDVKLDRQSRLAEKIVHPVMITGDNTTVHYLWSIKSENSEFAQQIADYAKLLSAVGWGIDLVAGNGNLLSEDKVSELKENYSGKCFIPEMNTGKKHRCPQKGSYDNLKMVYESKLNRIEGSIYTPPKKATSFGEISYIEDGLPFRHVACFRLLQTEDESERWASFDPRYTVRVSSWVRGYLCKSNGSVQGVIEDPNEYIAGHHKLGQSKTPPRFSYLPLPTIGHPHADGLIRRIIVAEPYGDDGKKVEWAKRNLNTSTLKNESGKDVARIISIETDSIFERYCGGSNIFKTVTPVILPGFDSLKYKKSEKLFLKAITQAGFNIEDIDSFILQKAPFFNGGYHPNDYQRVEHFSRYSPMHVLLKWKKKMRGPLAIGAGRHRGLGLFLPEPDREK